LAVKAFQLNNPGSRIYDRALEDLDPEELSGEVGPIELMLASPECTNHSVARGGAEPNKQSQETAFQVIRFAKVLQPRWLVVENVAKMRHWEEYGNWLQQLKSIGYTNPIETVLDAQDYGVAQSRKRLFVICDREGEVSIPPKRCGCKTTMSSVIRQVSSNGNSWAFRPMKGRGLAKATWARAHRAMRALGTDEEFLLVYYGTDGAGGWQSLDRPLRTITTLDRFALVRPNGKGHEMRMLQPPELAAAMGFPEDYVWPETARRNKIKLIGNAVCPPVMQAIVSHLIRK
jgi:DNA (cytosine-5)-methyltransferase 1